VEEITEIVKYHGLTFQKVEKQLEESWCKNSTQQSYL
jgi:hypothetical protein